MFLVNLNGSKEVNRQLVVLERCGAKRFIQLTSDRLHRGVWDPAEPQDPVCVPASRFDQVIPSFERGNSEFGICGW